MKLYERLSGTVGQFGQQFDHNGQPMGIHLQTEESIVIDADRLVNMNIEDEMRKTIVSLQGIVKQLCTESYDMQQDNANEYSRYQGKIDEKDKRIKELEKTNQYWQDGDVENQVEISALKHEQSNNQTQIKRLKTQVKNLKTEKANYWTKPPNKRVRSSSTRVSKGSPI